MAESGFLDTSVAIRYLVADDPILAERARRIIDGDAVLWLTDGTLAEIAHVLIRIYGIPRAAVVDELIAFIRRPNVRLHGLDPLLAAQALLLCRPSGRVSFADALLWAAARTAGAAAIYTFDERFPADGLAIRREV